MRRSFSKIAWTGFEINRRSPFVAANFVAHPLFSTAALFSTGLSEQDEMIQKFREHREACGGKSWVLADGSELSCWVIDMRKQYRDLKDGKDVDQLTEEMIDELNELEFDWGLKEKLWNSKYELLCAYKDENGHCRVPADFRVGSVNLSDWVTNQRREYKKRQEGKHATITKERIDRLNEIGIEWDGWAGREATARKEKLWNSNLELLRQYKTEKGDCLVPFRFVTENDENLGRWVGKQRSEYNKLHEGKPSVITKERIDELNKIGFVWDVHSFKKASRAAEGRKKWDSKLKLLLKYKTEKGDCCVPSSFKTDDGEELGKWVVQQRDLYRMKHLATDCVEKLNDIGFEWDVRKAPEKDAN